MHVEPGLVDGAKIALSYATAGGAGAYALTIGAGATGWAAGRGCSRACSVPPEVSGARQRAASRS